MFNWVCVKSFYKVSVYVIIVAMVVAFIWQNYGKNLSESFGVLILFSISDTIQNCKSNPYEAIIPKIIVSN